MYVTNTAEVFLYSTSSCKFRHKSNYLFISSVSYWNVPYSIIIRGESLLFNCFIIFWFDLFCFFLFSALFPSSLLCTIRAFYFFLCSNILVAFFDLTKCNFLSIHVHCLLDVLRTIMTHIYRKKASSNAI